MLGGDLAGKALIPNLGEGKYEINGEVVGRATSYNAKNKKRGKLLRYYG